jgi:hypothetical protein
MNSSIASTCSSALCTASLLWLAGCGAEVAGGAATVGALQAAQANEAKAQQQKILDEMKKVQDSGLARAASAADQ